MFAKIVTLTLMFVALAGGMLVLRQQRLQLANESATLHQEVVDLRESIWDAQSHAAGEIRPQRLEQHLEAAQLTVGPIAPPTLGPAARFAQGD